MSSGQEQDSDVIDSKQPVEIDGQVIELLALHFVQILFLCFSADMHRTIWAAAYHKVPSIGTLGETYDQPDTTPEMSYMTSIHAACQATSWVENNRTEHPQPRLQVAGTSHSTAVVRALSAILSTASLSLFLPRERSCFESTTQAESIMEAAARRFFTSPQFAVVGASQDKSKFGYKSKMTCAT